VVRAVPALCAGVLAASAWAADLLVPYVPTPQNAVERMLQMARISSADYLIDLGSGDGRIVIAAAKEYGARGFGVDLDPVRVAEANENARKAGVTGKVAFYQRDLFDTDLSQATVITMYLLPSVNLNLRPRLLDLKPGTRVVSHDFSMGDWRPDNLARLKVKAKYEGSGDISEVYFWVVPAKVAGTWRWELPLSGKNQTCETTLRQKYQEISGEARIGGQIVRLQNPVVHGDRIGFTFTIVVNGVPTRYEFGGRVEGDAIAGSAILTGRRLQSRLEWSAKRVANGAVADGHR
jgi:hypothetical protein